MSYRKLIFGFAMATLTTMLATGCYKDTTVLPSATGSDVVITKTVSFASDVLPIFEKSCALNGCHAAGGKKPDLSASNAYNSLNSGNYLNTGGPETSELYMWLMGKRGTQMPPNGADGNINAMILAWIKQGAKNN